jgi:hypothetical protein
MFGFDSSGRHRTFWDRQWAQALWEGTSIFLVTLAACPQAYFSGLHVDEDYADIAWADVKDGKSFLPVEICYDAR